MFAGASARNLRHAWGDRLQRDAAHSAVHRHLAQSTVRPRSAHPLEGQQGRSHRSTAAGADAVDGGAGGGSSAVPGRGEHGHLHCRLILRGRPRDGCSPPHRGCHVRPCQSSRSRSEGMQGALGGGQGESTVQSDLPKRIQPLGRRAGTLSCVDPGVAVGTHAAHSLMRVRGHVVASPPDI